MGFLLEGGWQVGIHGSHPHTSVRGPFSGAKRKSWSSEDGTKWFFERGGGPVLRGVCT